jgi:hypothetical protein
MKFTPEFTGIGDSLGSPSVFIIEEIAAGPDCPQSELALEFVL